MKYCICIILIIILLWFCFPRNLFVVSALGVTGAAVLMSDGKVGSAAGQRSGGYDLAPQWTGGARSRKRRYKVGPSAAELRKLDELGTPQARATATAERKVADQLKPIIDAPAPQRKIVSEVQVARAPTSQQSSTPITVQRGRAGFGYDSIPRAIKSITFADDGSDQSRDGWVKGASPTPTQTARAFEQVFEAAPDGFKTEAAVRAMFNEFVCGGKFHEVKGASGEIPWLYRLDYRGGRIGLDFDGWNPRPRTDETIGLAFEYMGPVHYVAPPGVGARKLHRIMANDAIKRQLAAANNVHLMIIHDKVPSRDMINYVKSRLKDADCLREGVPYIYIPEIDEPVIDVAHRRAAATLVFDTKQFKVLTYLDEVAPTRDTAKPQMQPAGHNVPRPPPGFTTASSSSWSAEYASSAAPSSSWDGPAQWEVPAN